MLGPSIITTTGPLAVGYALHATLKAADRSWAIPALVLALILALPLARLIPTIVLDLLRAQ